MLLEGLVACLCIGLLITCWYVWVGRIYQEYRHYTILRTALIKAHNVVTQVCAEHDYSIDTTDDVRVQVMKKYCGDIPVIEVNASWTNAPHKKGSITLYGIQDLRMSHNTAL